MHFEILNVEHGFSAYAIADDGNVLLFDCGSSSTMSPAKHLYAKGFREIQRFFIMNYDQDHISDIIDLRSLFEIRVLTSNMSISPDALQRMKSPVSPAMGETIDMRRKYIAPAYPSHRGIGVQCFYNSYPSFTDPNNLSLLVFMQIGGLSVALPGDLEQSGWHELLKNPQVCSSLRGVNVFIASHHGRENGYCKEVFDYCTPEIVVFSDGPIVYDTQQMASTYGQHASGIWFDGQTRKVLSTRKDGSLSWAHLEPRI